MRAVNLLPRDAAKATRITPQQVPVLVGAGLGVLVTGTLALSFLHASGQVRDAQTQRDDIVAQIEALPKPPPQETPRNVQLAGEQSARVTAVSTALGARLAWDRILREFSLVLPDDVWLTTLDLSTPDPAAAATGAPANNFSISGYTYSHDSVARLLARLALVPELSGITLANSTYQGEPGASGGAGTVQFSIQAGIKAPAGLLATAPPAPTPAPAPTTTDTTSTDAGASS
jgi:Tfp pilus assembly protein PilN